jgi:hypothetical protein
MKFYDFWTICFEIIGLIFCFLEQKKRARFSKEKHRNQLLWVKVPSSFSCYFIYMSVSPSVEIIEIMRKPSFTVSKVPTFSGIVLSDSMWHLVAFYLCYIVHIYLEGSPSPASHSKFVGLFTYSCLLFTHERRAVLKNWNGGIIGLKLKLALRVSSKILRYKCSQGREKYYSMHSSFLSLASNGRVLKAAACAAQNWLHM